MNMNAKEIIQTLGLRKSNYDGGYFTRTFQSDQKIGSAIYYMVTMDNFSRIHKCESDEMYHFYGGSSATLLVINGDNKFEEVVLGSDIQNGQHPQYLVKGGQWQGLKVADGGEYSLFGITVWPEFKPTEYTIKNRKNLIEFFGDIEEKINLITKYSNKENIFENGLGSNI